MPAVFRTPSRCKCDGEEALLVFLRASADLGVFISSPPCSAASHILALAWHPWFQRVTYPARWIDLQHFFRRSEGWLSEVCEAVRLHLDKIARKLLLQFDHKRIVPLIPVFAAAFKAKGCPLPYVWALLDGTFRDFCRPYKDGYSGLAQRVQYSGHKHAHGNNHQGLETPDGIIIEMHGPFEGPMHDQRMFRDSGLLARLMAHCAILTLSPGD